MSSLACRACGATFESTDAAPRCPTCLRKTSVVDPRAPRVEASAEASARPFSKGLFATRAAVGSVMVFVLTGGMVLRTMDTTRHADVLFATLAVASIFGGVLLAIGWTLFPRTRGGM